MPASATVSRMGSYEPAGGAPTGPNRQLTSAACNVYIACMGTKTISLKDEAYERLRAARRYPAESFSEVVLRATWPEDTTTARALLDSYRTGRQPLSGAALDGLEDLKRLDRPPEDKWAGR